ncbi:Xylan glycosyltransferase MUCI21 [Cardamine amara subsp. amara]|uniref:Xylan glycosyltransferase MUCI21 n=1 Tax=Cardamine amara subsp. amara TaxID=228776 RepID=A0ABD0ZG03_CARAN
MVTKTTSKSSTVAAVALFIVLVICFAFSTVFENQLFRSLRFPQGTLQQQTWDRRIIKQAPQETASATITCDRSHTNYDLCSINGSCSLDIKTGTLTLMDPTFATSASHVEKIRPYPRKSENWIMNRIKELTLTSGPLGLAQSCDITHGSPAIVFSAGGYTGNVFHDFMDGLIPLFITANSIYPDRDFILVVANSKKWWMSKYNDILSEVSRHKPILLDQENVAITHCFTSSIVGLISHGPMKIDPTKIPNSKSFVDFHNFLDKAFTTNLSTTLRTLKPRLILVSRYGSIGRVILNEKEVKEMLEDVGFEVIIFRPSKMTNLREAYQLIKSSHGIVGVHGAALTHLLFLRPGSVLVQIVPVGLGWVAKMCFETPSKAMNLEYSEYLLHVEESSLIEKYNKDDLVLKDPIAFRGMTWNSTKMDVYLKEQNVRLGVNRFRKYMDKAYEKAKLFMDITG